MSFIFETSPLHHRLSGRQLRLTPLQDAHIPHLLCLACDRRIWEYYPMDLSVPERHSRHLEEMQAQISTGSCQAFVLEHLHIQQPVGMTRLFQLNAANRQCEIGSWLAPQYWENGMNMEAKFLLLQYCFETLQLLRVQFRTDVRNLRSRRSLEKLGVHFEGILRKERVLENGHVRDAALYSIVDTDWPLIKARLLQKTKIRESADLMFQTLDQQASVSYVYP